MISSVPIDGSEPPSIRVGSAEHHIPYTGNDHYKNVPHLQYRLQPWLPLEAFEYVALNTFYLKLLYSLYRFQNRTFRDHAPFHIPPQGAAAA